jgi:hypothetical protein
MRFCFAHDTDLTPASTHHSASQALELNNAQLGIPQVFDLGEEHVVVHVIDL